jgi:hypothetical protein
MGLPYARHLAGGGGGPGSDRKSPNAFTRSARQRRRAFKAAAARLPKDMAPEEWEAALAKLAAKFGVARF